MKLAHHQESIVRRQFNVGQVDLRRSALVYDEFWEVWELVGYLPCGAEVKVAVPTLSLLSFYRGS